MQGRDGDRRHIVGHVARAKERRVFYRRHEAVRPHDYVERIWSGTLGRVVIHVAYSLEPPEVLGLLIVVCTAHRFTRLPPSIVAGGWARFRRGNAETSPSRGRRRPCNGCGDQREREGGRGRGEMYQEPRRRTSLHRSLRILVRSIRASRSRRPRHRQIPDAAAWGARRGAAYAAPAHLSRTEWSHTRRRILSPAPYSFRAPLPQAPHCAHTEMQP